MALSNIFREPRREITETVVGLGIFGLLGLADLGFAEWFLTVLAPISPDKKIAAWVVSLAVGALLGVVLIVVCAGIHAAGEAFCNYLEASGIRLRPRR